MSSYDEQKRPDTGKPFMHFVHECCREWGAEETSALLQMISASLPPAPIDKFEDFMPEFRDAAPGTTTRRWLIQRTKALFIEAARVC